MCKNSNLASIEMAKRFKSIVSAFNDLQEYIDQTDNICDPIKIVLSLASIRVMSGRDMTTLADLLDALSAEGDPSSRIRVQKILGSDLFDSKIADA